MDQGTAFVPELVLIAFPYLSQRCCLLYLCWSYIAHAFLEGLLKISVDQTTSCVAPKAP